MRGGDYTNNFNLIFWYDSLKVAIRDTISGDVVESERDVALLNRYEVVIRYYKYQKVVICPQIPQYIRVYDNDVSERRMLKGIKKELKKVSKDREIKKAKRIKL